jgi:hypothetical protein
MAKPAKFPRKFRQKLEKMRVNRGDDPGPGPTLAMDFLGKGTVQFMHTVLDDSSDDPREWKLRISHTLDKNRSRMTRNLKVIERLPPWETDEETPAST